MKKRVAVLISGNGSNLQALIDATRDSDFPAEIVQVISNKADAYGIIRAERAGIPTCVLNHKQFPDRESFDREIDRVCRGREVDIICLAGFMRIITPFLVQAWNNRMLNIHPSLLPAFPGAHALKEAWEASVQKTGCTVHIVREEVDSGPILIQAEVPVYKEDTLETLAERVHKAEHSIYPLALRMICENRIVYTNDDTINWPKTTGCHDPLILK